MLGFQFLARFFIHILALVVIGLCVMGVRAGRDNSGAPSSIPAFGSSSSESADAIRNVVLQEVPQAPSDGGSMLPDAVRGFWGKDKTEPGIQGEDTMKWANETFEALKAKGMTTANDASSWLTQDFKNMNAWEYKVVPIASADAGTAEHTLNKLGVERWECFHVQSSGRGQMFFFKKPKRSYLKSLPTADLMRLVPMMGRE